MGLLFKKTPSTRVTPAKTESFQCSDAYITTDGIVCRIIVAYRLHPKHKSNAIRSNVFFPELPDGVSKHILTI